VNARALWAIARRDLTGVRRSRAIMTPLLVIPLGFLVLLPGLVSLLPAMGGDDPQAARAFGQLMTALPAEARAALASGFADTGASYEQKWLLLVHTQLFPPLFLLVPFMVANVIAADSFAGERERQTLEALLYTPPTDAELFAGKVLAAAVPALSVSLLGFLLYYGVVTAVGEAALNGGCHPYAASLVLAAWVGPAFAAFGLAAMVAVSLRVQRTQDAVQVGGLFILPLIGLVVSAVKGAVVLRAGTLALIGAVTWALALVLLRAGVRSFRRARLVGRL
jgi:ABC-type Na+ efflux pump permease subunit